LKVDLADGKEIFRDRNYITWIPRWS